MNRLYSSESRKSLAAFAVVAVVLLVAAVFGVTMSGAFAYGETVATSSTSTASSMLLPESYDMTMPIEFLMGIVACTIFFATGTFISKKRQ
jgi:hypothetical protein